MSISATADEPVAQEERTQKDRCIEVYHETLRQRNSHKTAKVNKQNKLLLGTYSGRREREKKTKVLTSVQLPFLFLF